MENLRRGEQGQGENAQIRCQLPQRPRRGMSSAIHVVSWSTTLRSIGCSRWPPETKYVHPHDLGEKSTLKIAEIPYPLWV